MTAKEELSQYKYLRAKVDEALEEYEKYKTRAEKMTSLISESPSRSNLTSDKVGDNASIMADLSRQYESLWLATEIKKLEIEGKINKVEEPYRTILHKRYVQDKNLETISVEMHYSFDRMRHLHGVSLIQYSKVDT